MRATPVRNSAGLRGFKTQRLQGICFLRRLGNSRDPWWGVHGFVWFQNINFSSYSTYVLYNYFSFTKIKKGLGVKKTLERSSICMIYCGCLISSTKCRNVACESHAVNFCLLGMLSKQEIGNNDFNISKYISGKKSFEILIRTMKQITDACTNVVIFKLFNI